jgi:hypothetical protein
MIPPRSGTQQRSPAPPPAAGPGAATLKPSTLTMVGMTLAAVYIGALLVLMPSTTYDTWGALVVGPILIAVTLPILAHEARARGSRHLFWLLASALILKLAAAVAIYFVVSDVYGGIADATGYYNEGVRLSEGFRFGDFSGLESFTGTNFIRFLTGLLFSIIGTTKLGGFVVFSWLGFLGLFFFYRAFVTAVPEGRVRSYALPLFFLPSLLFWPSSIGKEAWMIFSLGIAALGGARMLSGQTLSGLIQGGVGLWLAALVRPHVAGLIAVALAAGFLLQAPRKELRQLAPVIKILATGAVVLVALFFVVGGDRFLQERGIDTEQGLTNTLYQITGRTTRGGSVFRPSVLESPGRAPVAAVTVLFRPLLGEEHNTLAVVAALESSFLLVLSLLRIRWILAAFRSIRRQPYVGFALAFTFLFILVFSGVANFGILVRQRIQLTPFYLVLLAIPPLAWGRREQERTTREPGGIRS